MGVFPHGDRAPLRYSRLPHVRGGVSVLYRIKDARTGSSPRAWGCFFRQWTCFRRLLVFPTCVGVFLASDDQINCNLSLPHVRGGVSYRPERPSSSAPSSPRAWGCFCTRGVCIPCRTVFPTCVGVFPQVTSWPGTPTSLPHVRGGVSVITSEQYKKWVSSPRAWGCFSQGLPRRTAFFVFPTCVGVFLAH